MRDISEVKIVPAGPGDAAALAAFGETTFREAFGADNTPDDMRVYLKGSFGETLQRAEIDNPAARTLLARSRDALVGYVQLWQKQPPDCVSASHAIEIRRFYVARDWRGSGLAAHLMETAFADARQRNADALWLAVWSRNDRAQAFYRKFGFTRVGTQIFMLGSDRQTDDILAVRTDADPDA